MMQAFRGAFARLKGRLFPSQWAGNCLLMLLAAGWVQIPDSHRWQFAFSMISGVLLVAAFLWLYTATFRHLRLCAVRPPWWLSCLLLAGLVVLFWLLLKPIAALRGNEGLYAGYLNSQSPPWLRGHFGYSSLVAWQEHIYDCAQYLLAGLLLPLAVEICACGAAGFRYAFRVYRHWLYWLAVLVCGFGAEALTWALADWTPVSGLTGQTMSLIARLLLAYSMDILLWCFVLALIAYYLDSETPKSA